MFTTKWIVYFQPFSDSRMHESSAAEPGKPSPRRHDPIQRPPWNSPFTWFFLRRLGRSSDFCCSLLCLYSADGIIWFAGLSESVRPSSRSRSCEHAEYMIMIDEQIFLKVKALERNQNELSSRPLLMPVMFDAFITKRNPRGGSLVF